MASLVNSIDLEHLRFEITRGSEFKVKQSGATIMQTPLNSSTCAALEALFTEVKRLRDILDRERFHSPVESFDEGEAALYFARHKEGVPHD